MTSDRKLYMSESFWETEGWLPIKLTVHLIKLYELFEVSKERLPQLEYLEVRLEVVSLDCLESQFLMKYQREVGVLTIISTDGEPLFWPQRSAYVRAHF